MARTLEEIQNEIILKKQELIPELNSGSKTAIWFLIVQVVAFAILTLETLFDFFKQEVDKTVSEARQGQLAFYINLVKDWQYGNILNPSTNSYDTIEEEKKIITRVSAREVIVSVDGKDIPVVRLKVAKSEPPVPLSSDEFDDLGFYLDKKKFAGVTLDKVNQPADVLTLSAQVWYNGQINVTDAREEVFTRTEAYLTGELQFDDVFNTNDLIAYVRQSDIIDNIKFTLLEAEGVFGIDMTYEAISGYMKLDRQNSSLLMIAQ